MARLLEEKPLRKALAEVLGMKDKMRVEVAAKRYKESLSRWSASPSLELAADLWKKRLKSRSERSLCRGGVQAPHLSWQQTSGRNGLNPEVKLRGFSLQRRSTDEPWKGFSYQVSDRLPFNQFSIV